MVSWYGLQNEIDVDGILWQVEIVVDVCEVIESITQNLDNLKENEVKDTQ